MALVFILDAQGVPVARLVGKNLVMVGSGDSVPVSGTAASLATYAGNGQSGVVGTALSVAPSVRVTDASGNPVAGSTVTWAPGGGSGTTSTGNTGTTNSNGVATVGSWSMGTTAGSAYTLFAYSTNLTNSPIRFSVTPVAGSAYSITASGGTSQTTTPAGTMPSRLTVLVHDQYGNAVSGATAALVSTDASGTFGSSILTTNASGIAGTTYVAGTGASVHSVTASLPSGASARFNMTTVAGPASTVAISSGDNQVGLAGNALANPVQVTVDDGYGNAIGSGATVQFVVVQGSGTLSRATATPLNSVSSVAWTLGATAGQNALEISLANVSNSTVTAFASGTNPTADTIFVVAGTGQSAAAGAALTNPLRWGVTGSGSSASGQIVDLTVTGDASLSTTRTVSSTSGLVSVTATAGTVASRYTVTISAGTLSGSPSSITFDATAGTATKLVITTQPDSNPEPGAAWNQQPVVISADTYGNPASTNTRVEAVLLSGDGTLASGVSTFATASGATASFSGMSYTQTSVNSFQVAFRCNSLSTATADVQTANPPFASKVAFTTQPSDAAAGGAIPSVVVAVQDSNGNTVTSSSAAIGLTIGTNPGGGTLSGTTNRNATSGVATFTGLSIDAAGTGYALHAASTGLSGATSSTFNITAGGDPYEPAGYTQIAARPFDSPNEDSWAPVFGSSYITTDATAPTSPSNVFQFIKSTGTGTAFAPGAIEKTISAHAGVYMRCAFKLSAAYYGNTSLINKLGPFFGLNGGVQMFLYASGSGAGTLYCRMAAQGCPKSLGPIDASGGANFGGNNYPLTRDRWYIARIHMVVNTYNVADGILKVWMEDTTTGTVTQLVNRTNMAYIGTGTTPTTNSGSQFDRSYLNAIHGGGAELPATDTRIFIDDYYASAP